MKDELKNPTAGDPGYPSDPWLDSLLDEALAPGARKDSIPEGMTDRIFEATRHRLAPPRRSVIARIGPSGWNAIAAAIVLATGAGIWLAASNVGQRSEDPSGKVALNNQPLVPETRGWPGDATVDQDLATLSMQVEDSQHGWAAASGFDNASDDADETDASRASSVF